MNEKTIKREYAYSKFAWLLFGLLFVYLFLRAWFVEPIHDEVATYLHYIETGIIWGDKAILDANNHLINSYLSRYLFLTFGLDFFWMRLPNVLSFGLFFWAIYQLIKPIENIIFRGIILVAITGIPFILDYFAYTRGYGISLAFFLAAIVMLKRVSETFLLKNLTIAYLFLIIAVYSNLTFLVSAILAILFILILQLLALKELNWKKQVSITFFHCILLTAIYPAIHYAETLKEGGALYYGSLAGFWEVTGKTLTKYTFFIDYSWFKWILLGVGALVIFSLTFLWFKKGTKQFFKNKETIIAWFLFGHIAVILFLAHFRDVNYPEDRVGMYLIPLSLLLLAYLVNDSEKTSYVSVGFLIFPILFIPRINLSTSVFSPEDRMSNKFYQSVINEVKPNTTIGVYPLMGFTWAAQNRKQEIKNSVTAYETFNAAADIILTKEVLKVDPRDLADYDTLTRDFNSGFIAYKRKKPFVKSVVFDTTFTFTENEGEFIGFRNILIPDSLRNKKLQIHIEGDFTTSSPFTTTNLVYSSFDKDFNPIVYESWNQRWSHGVKQNFFMNFNFPVDKFYPEENEVRIYLWNMDKEKISIKNGKFEIILLE